MATEIKTLEKGKSETRGRASSTIAYEPSEARRKWYRRGSTIIDPQLGLFDYLATVTVYFFCAILFSDLARGEGFVWCRVLVCDCIVSRSCNITRGYQMLLFSSLGRDVLYVFNDGRTSEEKGEFNRRFPSNAKRAGIRNVIFYFRVRFDRTHKNSHPKENLQFSFI